MSDEAAFLTALKANPPDDTTRLVYADWLDEHNKRAKGQYLRAVVDLVRHAKGTAEYTDAVELLYLACVQTDGTWRDAAGARFDVILEHYNHNHKIPIIIAIRERAGLGLAEGKTMAESVPTPLFSLLPYERAFALVQAFQGTGLPIDPKGIYASIRPTLWPAGAVPGAVFDVHLYWSDFGACSEFAIRELSGLLGVSQANIRRSLRDLPLVIGAGLQPVAVADLVRRLELICNVPGAMPAVTIRLVQRQPKA
jgi:uncharacterized protein (TIGR02996 family)